MAVPLSPVRGRFGTGRKPQPAILLSFGLFERCFLNPSDPQCEEIQPERRKLPDRFSLVRGSCRLILQRDGHRVQPSFIFPLILHFQSIVRLSPQTS